MLVISSVTKVILYVSRSYVGSAHDFGILKQEFPPEKPWFTRFEIRLDLGFQGFADLYPCRQLYIPIKKPKKKELPQEAKDENKEQASQRVTVEQASVVSNVIVSFLTGFDYVIQNSMMLSSEFVLDFGTLI